MPKETPAGRVQRLELSEAFKESGQTIADFARERGITPWKVRYALRKSELEVPAVGNGFQEVPLPGGSSGEFVVTLRGGRELRVPVHFSEKRVRQLITILESC